MNEKIKKNFSASMLPALYLSLSLTHTLNKRKIIILFFFFFIKINKIKTTKKGNSSYDYESYYSC